MDDDTDPIDTDLLVRIHTTYKAPDRRHIAQLPRPTRKGAAKGDCPTCGGYHGLPAVHLDYMGHAEVTDVLLAEDPLWNWEPYALDEAGLPMIYHVGPTDHADLVMWIRLTIGGLTRVGVGTAPASKGGDAIKELIGDALRNAAMRFGIALDLWSKAEGVDQSMDAGQPIAPDTHYLPEGFEPYEGVWTREVIRGMSRPTLVAECNMRDVWPDERWKDDVIRRRLWELVEPPATDDPPPNGDDDPDDGGGDTSPSAPPAGDDGMTGDDDDADDADDESGASADAVADDDEYLPPTPTEVNAMLKRDLVEWLRYYGLATNGKVDALKDRLGEYVATLDAIDDEAELAAGDDGGDVNMSDAFDDGGDDTSEQWIIPDMVPDIEAAIGSFDTAEARAFAQWRKKVKAPSNVNAWTYAIADSFWALVEAIEADR